jgi:hypothetical protein
MEIVEGPARRWSACALLAAMALAAPARAVEAEGAAKAIAVAAPGPAGQAAAPPAAAPAPAGPWRWFDLQAATLATRYRGLEPSTGDWTARQQQTAMNFKPRFKFDRGARLTLTGLLATGQIITSCWNATGIGTGDFTAVVNLRQLYLTATPVKGVDAEYGGIGVVRGESTEITNYDNDIYLVGERVTVRRPSWIWLDEATVTVAYLGDFNTPNFLRRTGRLSETNYQQYLGAKKIGKRAGTSLEYARYLGVGTLRAAGTVKVPEARVVGAVRVEYYERFGAKPGRGFAAVGERTLGKRVTVSGGYDDVDRDNPPLNGDRYLRGQRLFVLATVKLPWDLSTAVYYTHAFDTDYLVVNHQRVELVLTYNLLAGLRRVMPLP